MSGKGVHTAGTDAVKCSENQAVDGRASVSRCRRRRRRAWETYRGTREVAKGQITNVETATSPRQITRALIDPNSASAESPKPMRPTALAPL